MTKACFHCTLPIPAGTSFSVEVEGKPREVCCIGCQAAATTIAGAGLTQFYAHRQPVGDAALQPRCLDFTVYDDPASSRQFVTSVNANEHGAIVYIGDLYCPACIWLVDQVLTGLPGVIDVTANAATRRMAIRWEPEQLSFSALLTAIAELGFVPEPVIPGQEHTAATQDYRGAIKRLLVAGIFGMQSMMFAVGLYAGDFYGQAAAQASLLKWASLLVTIPILLVASRPFFRGAWIGLKLRQPGMDVPVALAISIAFAASVWATVTGQGEVYFDSVAMFVFLLSLSRFIEMRARHTTDNRAQALAAMLPMTAARHCDGHVESVPVAALQVDDEIFLQSDDVVAVDGIVMRGELTLDEHLLTGESRPVIRHAGDRVLAGARVVDGSGVFQATAVGAATHLGEMARLIEKAQHDRSGVQLLADRIASLFVMAVIGLATVCGAFWWIAAPDRTLEIVLAILIVACPCALSLATPTTLASAAGSLTRQHFLLIQARLLHVLRPGALIVFDKTGTLTRAQPRVTDTECYAPDAAVTSSDVLKIAAALEAGSVHVLAEAFRRYRDPAVLCDVPAVSVVGSGVQGSIGGNLYRMGNWAFVTDGLAVDSPPPAAGHARATTVYLADRQQVLARFSVCDEVRSDAVSVVAQLRDAGFDLAIASGDQTAVVAEVAQELGISTFRGGMTPADKLAFIEDARQQGRSVVMVGDGVNDAPVLAAADASVAIANGAPLARASADGLLLGQALAPLYTLAQVAAASRRVIAQSLIWAATYNFIAILFAACGWVAPWMAAIGMSLSSILVVANALRVRDVSREQQADHAPLAEEVVV